MVVDEKVLVESLEVMLAMFCLCEEVPVVGYGGMPMVWLGCEGMPMVWLVELVEDLLLLMVLSCWRISLNILQ